MTKACVALSYRQWPAVSTTERDTSASSTTEPEHTYREVPTLKNTLPVAARANPPSTQEAPVEVGLDAVATMLAGLIALVAGVDVTFRPTLLPLSKV